jgi:hypothetical protein
MIQVDSKEMITAAYSRDYVPASTDLVAFCQAFCTRDIRAENKPLELVLSSGSLSQSNPDAFC